MKKKPEIVVVPRTAPAAPPAKPQDSWRETVESVVVAFVLAFLFRTFEAEAFVIPTGSMAPTLYGQHRDVYCEQCGTRFATGVNSLPAIDAEIRDDGIVPSYRANFAYCPNANCQFPNNVLDKEMFAGDRILVNKFPYEFRDPERWDVVVFKFPEQAKTNYIKRLAGLPGEELKIKGGDVWVRPLSEENGVFRIPRKTPEKQRKLQLLVHDDNRPATKLIAAGWPESWEPADLVTTGWVADRKARAYRVDPKPGESDHVHWMRYTHYLPSAAEWTRALAGQGPAQTPRAQLIKDLYAYNRRVTASQSEAALRRDELPEWQPDRGVNEMDQWVGDLTLSCTVEVFAPTGDLIFELIEGQRGYRCQLDLIAGNGIFLMSPDVSAGEQSWKTIGDPLETDIMNKGPHAVSFANVDDRLCLWIDDQLVKSLEFEPDSVKFPAPFEPILPTDRDTSPVAIGGMNCKVRISNLKIERDIYYTTDQQGMQSDRELRFILHDDPADDRNDEFLMLGDNSPRSNDSRWWSEPHTVPRHLLIGKAFFVYWPHAVPFLNGGRGFPAAKYYENPRSGSDEPPGPPLPKFSVPFYPQVGRMHRIR